ncbi:hypothetical protein KIL84_021912 [Mauremys mutica]|uniref:Uncharacterized protein n=1 Tax=Mauremys mutica TaxID=74926 RepID=A0A9D3XF09_9SAUR|nr:hypothetical protein KIL84_021912 [Mauremys mutica]
MERPRMRSGNSMKGSAFHTSLYHPHLDANRRKELSDRLPTPEPSDCCKSGLPAPLCPSAGYWVLPRTEISACLCLVKSFPPKHCEIDMMVVDVTAAQEDLKSSLKLTSLVTFVNLLLLWKSPSIGRAVVHSDKHRRTGHILVLLFVTIWLEARLDLRC